jgi:hypothetical protein
VVLGDRIVGSRAPSTSGHPSAQNGDGANAGERPHAQPLVAAVNDLADRVSLPRPDKWGPLMELAWRKSNLAGLMIDPRPQFTSPGTTVFVARGIAWWTSRRSAGALPQ